MAAGGGASCSSRVPNPQPGASRGARWVHICNSALRQLSPVQPHCLSREQRLLQQRRLLGQAEQQVHVLDGLPGGALDQVVDHCRGVACVWGGVRDVEASLASSTRFSITARGWGWVSDVGDQAALGPHRPHRLQPWT